MIEYTGWQYLLIDVANNSPFGLDKQTFEKRIAWTTENLTGLENDIIMALTWKEKPLYIKAVMAVRKAQAGIPTGHLVGLDAVCSGMQLMSAVTGCIAGATASGLVDPNRRADAYTDCTNIMGDILGVSLPNGRDAVKTAVMTTLYGSKLVPKEVFGEGTVELDAFHQAMYQLAPGACELLTALIQSWQSDALVHAWKMPDGFDARVKVMVKDEVRIEVDELNHSSFTYQFYTNAPLKKAVKNAANVIHSIDGYVLRSLIRRCNYDHPLVSLASQMITAELMHRELHGRFTVTDTEFSDKVAYYIEQYERSGMPDVVIIEHLTEWDIRQMSTNHLWAINGILSQMLEHKSFPIVTVHDDFKAHPNNLNAVRKHYREILAQLAESKIIEDILSQIHKIPGEFPKTSSELPNIIRRSAYALC